LVISPRIWLTGSFRRGYPQFDELIRAYREVRKQNLALLDEIGDAGLDGPTINPPPGLEKQFGTAGQVFATIARER
jgi:hypothetical protein